MAEEKKDKAEYELDLASDCGWIRGLDAAGKPIRISKVDMVELIRANMPVATSEKNGLLSSGDLLRVKTLDMEINPGQSYNTGIAGYKVLMMSNGNSGDTSIAILGYFNSLIIGQDSGFSNYDSDGKICIFKIGSTYVIKNNTNEIRIIIITVL